MSQGFHRQCPPVHIRGLLQDQQPHQHQVIDTNLLFICCNQKLILNKRRFFERSFSQFAEKLNMDEEEEAERWIANLITGTHVDAKIDRKNVSSHCSLLISNKKGPNLINKHCLADFYNCNALLL